ncbi:MAG: hypothetical protein Kow0027_12150 [Saprospiraceae bacterium]
MPPLPADTIYLSEAPDGEAGVFYEEDISFRLPKTTTPVNATDPSTPAGLNINKITIISLVGLPPGLSWEANQMEFNPGNETDGCVRFCGTPLQPGLYDVQVFVTAEVLVVNQSTSFSFPIYIAPSSSVNAGFAMTNNSGCGSVTVEFENNVPSAGQDGFTYLWDFGNGFQSLSENPPPVTYDEPGVYEVKYEATVDTAGYTLTTVHVLATGCGDTSIPPIFNGAPDLYLKIKNPDGDIIFQTSPVNNAPVPFAFTVNLPLEEGNYELEVRDDDTFGSETCGTVNFNRTTTGTLASGSLEVALDIIHPVTTIQTTDTVRVYELPEQPLVEPAPAVQACSGESVLLTANYDDNLQWYRDTTLLFGENFPELMTDEPGNYWVSYTSPDGCMVESDAVSFTLLPLPAPPAFFNDKNLLRVNEPSLLPANHELQWLVNGVAVPGANGLEFCITEPGTQLYTLLVTDLDSGCKREYSLGATYDPDFDCLTPVGEALSDLDVIVYPNPADQFISVVLPSESLGQDYSIRLVDLLGQVHDFQGQTSLIQTKLSLDCSAFPAGVYFLVIEINGRKFTQKLILE